MTKKNITDFRTLRGKLPADAFLLGPKEPDSLPQDLIDEKIWKSIISFPDDVSLRISDNHGTELKAMHELWASWIESIGEEKDAIWYVMLDVADELQACLFNSLNGFYRVAASCLRSALELTTTGTYFQLILAISDLLKWKEGKNKSIHFGKACDYLHENPQTRTLNDFLKSKVGFSIFNQKSANKPEGWARKLHSELSNFVHSRSTHSLGMMWEGSNGPIYVPESFGKVYALCLDTMALAYVLLIMKLNLIRNSHLPTYLFQSPKVRPSQVAVYSYEFFWG